MVPSQTADIKYAGSTPGADANTYVLLATTNPGTSTDPMNANWSQRFFALTGTRKVTLTLKCDNAGTLKVYEQKARNGTWRQIDQVSVSAPAATSSFVAEFDVEGLDDWKLEWVNGGSAQTFWDVFLSLSDQRAAPL